MPSLNKTDRSAFDEWWDDSHCVGDGEDQRRENSDSYVWSREAFEWGMQYGREDTGASDRESYEETIRQLHEALESSENEVTELKERIEERQQGITAYEDMINTLNTRLKSAEELACRRGEVLMNLRKEVSRDTSEEGIELAKLRSQRDNLVLAVAALSDVINGEVL